MTRMLASVANFREAQSLLSVGVDILDIKEPRQGALGAVDTRTVKEIVNHVAGRTPTSATIGDLPMQADRIAAGIAQMRTTGVDIVKVGVFAARITTSVLNVVRKHTQSGTKIVLVYFADMQPALDDFPRLAAAGIYGVMLDTADKTGGSLRSIMDEDALRSFVHTARVHGLMAGLAGSLQVGDIHPLLNLMPDYLGFRGALCSRGLRRMAIDMQAARTVRAMIPVNSYASPKGVHLIPSPLKGEGRVGVEW